MNCPQCGTHNEDTARFCSNCGTPLSPVQQATPVPPRPPVSAPVSDKKKTINIISIIAAGLLAIGFFLPWINYGELRQFSYGVHLPNINGLFVLDKLLGENLSNEAIVPIILMVILLVSIPVCSIAYIIQKIMPKAPSVKWQTWFTSMAVFLPMLMASVLLFVRSKAGYVMLFGGAGLGVGVILMIIGALFLFGEAFFRVIEKTDQKTLPAAWIKASIAGLITAGLHYLLIELTKKNEESDIMVNIYTVFTVAVLAIGVNIALFIHKKQDLNGKLSFSRCIGFSLIYGLVAGIGWYLVILMQTPMNEAPGGVIMALIAFDVLLAFVFGALYALNAKLTPTEAIAAPLDKDFLKESDSDVKEEE